MNLKNYFSKFSLQDWVFTLFSILWIAIIILDYLNKQVVYLPSITHFKYINLFFFLTLLGILLSASYTTSGPIRKFKAVPINGLIVFGLSITIIWAITLSYNKYWNAPLDYTHYLHLAGKGIFTIGCSFLLVLASFSSGNLIRTKFIPEIRPKITSILVDISLGFVLYTFIMMLLGSLALLDKFILLGILSLMILTNYQASFAFTKRILWTPIQKPKDLTVWGALIAFFILVYVVMNYLYTQAPYPLGFDARNYYVNIAKLIGESGELIAGFQPYAWSLVMSTGYIAFESPEITMFISAMGGILSLFAIYYFSRFYIQLSSNYSMLVVMLYLLTPTVTNHFIIEFKIDLSLLFFQMVTLMFVLWWMFEKHKKQIGVSSLLQSREDYATICLLGVLLGYGLSIKVLSVFLIFGIFVGIWSYNRDIFGVLGLCAASIGVILIAGLDNLSGLRDYHLSPATTGIILSLIGISLLGYSFTLNRTRFISTVKVLFICGAVSLFTFSPWMYKNYRFVNDKSMITLFLGEKPRPKMNMELLDENYKKYLEEQEQ